MHALVGILSRFFLSCVIVLMSCGGICTMSEIINKVPGLGSDIRYSGGQIRLGGGLPGFVPHSLLTNSFDDEYAQSRFYIRKVFNNADKEKRIVGPFRAQMNAGDLLCRKNYSCGGSSCAQSRPQQHGLGGLIGRLHNNCDNTGVPAANCNGKFVYDSSDYTTFKKKMAIKGNYNDRSYGGDNYKAAQSVIRHAHHY